MNRLIPGYGYFSVTSISRLLPGQGYFYIAAPAGGATGKSNPLCGPLRGPMAGGIG